MTTCWVCGGASEPFYRVSGIPTSSCVLHETRDGARSQPHGDLALAVCHTCGFIQNDAFDPRAVDYFAPYEESQGASGTFNTFVDAQLDQLATRHDLNGKTLLEVGCGKAEWLGRACERFGATGIGYDPSYVPGRAEEGTDRFAVVKEFFHGDTGVHADLVACRHTLEHVSNVGELISWMGAAASGDPGVVFIEVPDTQRILDEGAFWDVYYEHAAYFTAGSLANLHTRQGLELLSLETGFSDQYLLSEARVSTETQPIVGASDIVESAHSFGVLASGEIERWQMKMRGVDATDRVVWAATSKTVAFLAAVDAPVAAAVDINRAKQGSFLPGSGTPIVGPEALVDIDPKLVIVMNPIYLDEIQADIDRLGLNCQVVALGSSAESG